MLIATIAITGVNFGGEAVTANAATKYETLNVNSSGDSITINMKVGETKRLLITDENGKDIVTSRGWVKPYSREVVTITTDFADENWTTEYMEITANDVGEVTIKGRTEGYITADRTTVVPKESWPNDIRITIKVTKAASKLTATQKKCRQFWKTLKKATCQRVGTKTCKKCKLQKTIKKTDHKWVSTTRTSYATEDIIFEAGGHGYREGVYYQEVEPVVYLSDYIPHELIRRAHYIEYQTINDEGKIVGKGDIVGLPEGTEEAKEAKEAFFAACREEIMSGWQLYGYREVTDRNDPIVEELETCFYCAKEK